MFVSVWEVRKRPSALRPTPKTKATAANPKGLALPKKKAGEAVDVAPPASEPAKPSSPAKPTAKPKPKQLKRPASAMESKPEGLEASMLSLVLAAVFWARRGQGWAHLPVQEAQVLGMRS